MLLDADALASLKRYLAFIETRAESVALADASPADRAEDLRDIKRAVEAARQLVTAKTDPVVLVVDDEPAIHQLARRLLEPERYQVLSALDAPAALVALTSSSAHVAICDIHMPGPNGLWLAERIRAAFPSTAIVFASADETLQSEEMVRPPVVGYVVKPFNRERLLRAVADGVRWSHAQAGGSENPQDRYD